MLTHCILVLFLLLYYDPASWQHNSLTNHKLLLITLSPNLSLVHVYYTMYILSIIILNGGIPGTIPCLFANLYNFIWYVLIQVVHTCIIHSIYMYITVQVYTVIIQYSCTNYYIWDHCCDTIMQIIIILSTIQYMYMYVLQYNAIQMLCMDAVFNLCNVLVLLQWCTTLYK